MKQLMNYQSTAGGRFFSQEKRINHLITSDPLQAAGSVFASTEMVPQQKLHRMWLKLTS